MSTETEIYTVTLEGIHYINLPAAFADSSIPSLEKQIDKWAEQEAYLHVLDMQKVVALSSGFVGVMQKFSKKLVPKQARIISINMSDSISREVTRLGADSVFNRIQSYPGDLYEKKTIAEPELKRLLFKYLAQATYKSVEVALNSTVSVDENYSAKPVDVPWHELDLISVVSVNTSFVHVEFRLCCSTKVLTQLARAMLGNQSNSDSEVLESMASELLNMIYGHAKSNLNDKESFQLPPAIPRILRKADFWKVKRSSPPTLTIMPMVTPMGPFYIEVDFGKAQTV